MSLIALSQQDEYDLAHSDQDCRGWTVTDARGTALGICTDMIVDTDAEHIHAIVLDTGARILAADIALHQGTVVVGAQDGASPTGTGSSDMAALDVDGRVTVPVIEERIKVGKREVSSGGIRVSQRVTEQPVEETVTLRDERVIVERRPVNQPAGSVSADAFTDSVIEVTETEEEVVVAKRARVIEEVVVSKAVTERQEVVRDTVKRTDIDVQPLDVERGGTAPMRTEEKIDDR